MTDRNLATLDPTEQKNLDLVKNTYASQLTQDEFALVVAEANSRGLSVVNKEIVGIKFQGKMSTFLTIAGLRKLSERSGKIEGVEGPYWRGKDTGWLDVWLDDKVPPAAAKFIIYRKDSSRPIVAVATWKERAQHFYDTKGGGLKLGPTWAAMPAHMLAKVAETDAYRRARLFPDDMEISWDADEGEEGGATVSVRSNRKDSAMKRLHAVGKAAGVDHDKLRAVVREIEPGIESLTDDAVTADVLYQAADIVATFGADAVVDVIEGEPVESDNDGPPTPDELWRHRVKEVFATGTRQDSQDLIADAAKSQDPTRWLTMIELAPSKPYRDRVIDLALGNCKDITQAQIDSVVASRADAIQVARAQEMFDPAPRERTN